MDGLSNSVIKYLFHEHLSETITIFSTCFAFLYKLSKKIISTIYLRNLPIGLVENLKEASSNYVLPSYVYEDPSHYQEPKQVPNTQKGLVKHIEKSFRQGSKEKRIIILADSGMGKTALLLNLYYRYIRKLFKRYNMYYIELGSSNAIDKINQIENPSNTILLLDALDENKDAINNYYETFKRIVYLTSNFYRVIISCRTQFFTQDKKIPELIFYSGGVMSAGEPVKGIYNKIYIAPFSDFQIKLLLFKKYILTIKNFSFKRYKKASMLVEKIPYITVRPMLLNYVDYLLNEEIPFSFTYQIYESMIRGWLKRRKSEELDPKYEENLKFVYLLGKNLALNYKRREGYHIPAEELFQLANEYNINIKDWQITGRSLLNINAAGDYKFSHFSILESILARALFLREDLGNWEPTPLTEIFLKEMNIAERIGEGEHYWPIHEELKKNLIGFDLTNLNLSGKNISKVNFSNANISKSNLSKSDLTSSTVVDAILDFADLSEAELNHVNLSNSHMKGVSLIKNRVENAIFENTDLTGSDLSHSEFINCNFKNSKLFGALLTGTKFIKCDLSNGDLRCIRIKKENAMDIYKPKFYESILENAILPKDYDEFFYGNIKGKFIIDIDRVVIE